jgi:hypothetical protein
MIPTLPERLLRIVFILSILSASAKRTLRKPGYNDLMRQSYRKLKSGASGKMIDIT